MKLAKTMRADQSILVNLSGRGDKDIGTVADLSGADFYDRPSMRGLAVKGGEQPKQFSDGSPLGKLAPSGGSAVREATSVGVKK